MEETFSDDIERMMVLKSIPMFSDLDIEALYQVLKIARYKKGAPGETIIKKGDSGHSFYVLLDGRAAVYLAEGTEPIAYISPGESFGELGIVDKQERTTNTRVLEKSLMLEFEGDEFLNLIEKNSSIAFAVVKNFSQRLRSMIER